MKKKLFRIFLLLFCVLSMNAQHNDKKWSVGFNASVVFFNKDGIRKVKDNVNSQFPSLQVSRKIGKNLSIDLIYTFEMVEIIKGGNAFPYSALDAYLSYDLPELFFNIYPFVGIGAGYISGATTTPDPQGSLSLNFMGGGILWLTDRFGLTGRLIYKNVSADSESMATHFQGLAGVIFNLDVGSNAGERRKRIWDRKH
ncbi:MULTISPECIES: hypothetical protein [unclassified Polaribacter]|uniref:hypothetical protein n=1 Tax=unclassified Polaribacter TaxID=196858 RepID=UPI0011BDC338|nr:MULTISPECIES: hypothetical protein [unclassified Polaribacter]TXD54200.1 hypothetical protein ES043_01495 [Polaribacter sp. IC063]TXD62465.1 hypothetical protein ES044_01705 [Polaribacter sp. IC066]